uniref:USP domain-containing protein n=1 Tax=Rodentolepis nana TaxID=102285 RepID=A0A0R3TNU9_RODNA
LQVESTSKTSPASPSYIADTFIGCQSRVSNCATCRWEIDKREETFTTLMLSLEYYSYVTNLQQNDNENKPSIQSMVDSLSRELIEDTPKCEKCGGDDNGVYSRNVDVTFRKAPPCLLLNVKIFYFDMVTGSTVKNMSKFDINKTITMKLIDGAERHYKLFGIVFHQGYLATLGHYIWACKMFNVWTIFDDKDVRITNFEEIVSLASLRPYILVYTTTEK